MVEDDDRYARPAGHRYGAPASDVERRSKSWDYAILAVLVVVILVLIATGVVPVFDF